MYEYTSIFFTSILVTKINVYCNGACTTYCEFIWPNMLPQLVICRCWWAALLSTLRQGVRRALIAEEVPKSGS